MSDFTFKEVGKNEYETFMEGKTLNIFFKIPDGCSIEDYELYFTEEDFKPCKDVVIKLQNPPKTFKSINVASNADITFKDGLSFCVNNSITLAKNKNLLFCAKDGVKEVDEELDGIKNYTKYKELSEAKEIIKNSVKQKDSFEEFESL